MKIFLSCAAVLLVVTMGYLLFSPAHGTEEAMSKIDIPIKKLLVAPKEGAKTAYEIPLGVRLIAVSADKKWYKARISYNFFGYFQTEGWVKVE